MAYAILTDRQIDRQTRRHEKAYIVPSESTQFDKQEQANFHGGSLPSTVMKNRNNSLLNRTTERWTQKRFSAHLRGRVVELEFVLFKRTHRIVSNFDHERKQLYALNRSKK